MLPPLNLAMDGEGLMFTGCTAELVPYVVN
jgi:hypothetical protein